MTDKHRPIDMQALRIFLATAQDCNMSRAAVRLGISQSAVSQSVRLLEENFGAPLLNRASRPLTLTPAGVALAYRGRMLLEESLNLRGAVIEASRGIKPSLRLGLVDSFAATCGVPLVQQMLRDTAQLSVRTGLTPNLSEALVRRELDMVISSRPLDVDGMRNHLLMTEEFFVIAPVADTPERAVPVCRTVADLPLLARALPIVRFNQQSHFGEQAERALRRLNLTLPRRLEVDTADTLTAMVAGGIGWAITTPLCLLQGAHFAHAVRHDVVAGLGAQRHLYLHARVGEFDALAEETFARIVEILRSRIADALAAIKPELSELIHLHPWSERV